MDAGRTGWQPDAAGAACCAGRARELHLIVKHRTRPVRAASTVILATGTVRAPRRLQVEDRIQRTRLRFMNMLENAETAADWAAQDGPSVPPSSSLRVAVVKAMNRAAGFLEAVSIVLPELGPELLDEFEISSVRVESRFQATERRIVGGHRSRDDRRAQDRRLGHDRRRHSMEMSVERRVTSSRRAETDRRTGKVREFADRRWRAVRS
jgi:hypothetical protein